MLAVLVGSHLGWGGVAEARGGSMNAVNLREFGQQLIAGRNVLGSFPDLTVYLDYTLLGQAVAPGPGWNMITAAKLCVGREHRHTLSSW